jgi:hypothetical protein
MAKVQGTVEAVSTKFGKFSVLVDGTWYATKQEYVNFPEPSSGDNIEFDDGGSKFLKRVKILGSSSGASTGGRASPKKNFNPLGVELGHASKLAMDMAIASFPSEGVGSKDFYQYWTDHTENVYKIMKGLRETYEHRQSSTEELAAKAEAVVSPPKKGISRADSEDIF